VNAPDPVGNGPEFEFPGGTNPDWIRAPGFDGNLTALDAVKGPLLTEFGTFNAGFLSDGDFNAPASSISDEVINTSDIPWTSADQVLIANDNGNGFLAAISIGACAVDDCNSNVGPLAESQVGNGAIIAVPETSTWEMMLISFAGLGFAGFKRASKITLA